MSGQEIDVQVASLGPRVRVDEGLPIVRRRAARPVVRLRGQGIAVEIEPNDPSVMVPVPGKQGPRGADGPVGGQTEVVAGQALGGHRVVRPQADGSVVYATNLDLFDAGRPLWLTLGAANNGQHVTVQTFGLVIEPSWSWVDGPVYLASNGLLTQVAPVSPAIFLVQLGSSDGPTGLFYDPRTPIAITA